LTVSVYYIRIEPALVFGRKNVHCNGPAWAN